MQPRASLGAISVMIVLDLFAPAPRFDSSVHPERERDRDLPSVSIRHDYIIIIGPIHSQVLP